MNTPLWGPWGLISLRKHFPEAQNCQDVTKWKFVMASLKCMLVSKIPQPNPIGKTHMCFVCKLDAYMVVFPSGSLLSCVLLYQPPMSIPWTKTIGELWCIQSWSFHEKYVFQMTMELFEVLIRKQNYYNLVFRNFILPALITYMIT